MLSTITPNTTYRAPRWCPSCGHSLSRAAGRGMWTCHNCRLVTDTPILTPRVEWSGRTGHVPGFRLSMSRDGYSRGGVGWWSVSITEVDADGRYVGRVAYVSSIDYGRARWDALRTLALHLRLT